MRAESPAGWVHGRELTGAVHRLSVGAAAPATVPGGTGARSEVRGPISLTVAGLAGDVGVAAGGTGAGADARRSGWDEAVTVYPWEHHGYWSDALQSDIEAGVFGENLISIGLSEDEVFVGDTFAWGTATLQVSGPRRPDPGPGARLGIPGLADRMIRDRRTGFSMRVLGSGKVAPEDVLRLVDLDPVGLSVADIAIALTAGPAAVGLTDDRVRLVRPVLSAYWVEQLDALMAPEVDPQLTGSSS